MRAVLCLLVVYLWILYKMLISVLNGVCPRPCMHPHKSSMCIHKFSFLILLVVSSQLSDITSINERMWLCYWLVALSSSVVAWCSQVWTCCSGRPAKTSSLRVNLKVTKGPAISAFRPLTLSHVLQQQHFNNWISESHRFVFRIPIVEK